ncbi:hypothetical protein B0J11DRAFT_601954 [Dendryphion nanum]|uniref:Uncharacterized protein n=1 Tax=Dendryphion nanum TaxID=256645 RepID=A0A9P9I621_9PLEO|nr:hypothetical protein B0J11DRAFT_601954 [Dendryphion nanum]
MTSLSALLAGGFENGVALPGIVRFGASGPAVTVLHACLLSLGFGPNSAREVGSATFGTWTRDAVIEFQTKTYGSGSKVTALVDEDTAAKLADQLRKVEPNPSTPSSYFIAGQVLFDAGVPGAKLTIRIFDRNLRTERELVKGETDSTGSFLLKANRKLLEKPSNVAASLFVRVYHGEKLLHDPAIGETAFNTSILTLFPIQIDLEAPLAPSPDQFTTIARHMEPFLPIQPAGAVATALDSVHTRIASLVENVKFKDVTTITEFVGRSKSAGSVVNVVMACRLAEAAQKLHKLTIPPDFFHALLSSSASESFSPRVPSNMGLVDVDVSTPVEPLLYELALLENSRIESSIISAVDRGLASKATAKDLKSTMLQVGKLKIVARPIVARQPTIEDECWKLIGEFLKNGGANSLKKVLEDGDYNSGDLMSIILDFANAMIPSNPTADNAGARSSDGVDTALASATAKVELTEEGIHTASADNLAAVSSKTVEELARMTVGELDQLLSSQGTQTAKFSRAEQLRTICKELETCHPSAAFAANLRSNVKKGTDLISVKSTTRVNKTPCLVDFNKVSSFLEKNPSFDLAKDSVYEFQRASESSDHEFRSSAKNSIPVAEDFVQPGLLSQIESVKATQRVFKLVSPFRKVKKLLDIGIHSAASIQTLGQDRLSSLLEKDPNFGPSDIESLFNRASAVTAATRLLVGTFQSIKTAVSISGVNAPLAQDKLDAVTKDFPNMRSLFQLGDVCACSDCMTVYSPSSYLVDILQFLKNRLLLDSPGGPNSGLNAREALFKRRPDIGNLDLSCDNTKVTLPYIDLVCELLENLVSPQAGMPYTGIMAPGIIKPELLSVLRTTHHLPFTKSALVSDADALGHYIVRDKGVVVRMVRRLGPFGNRWVALELKQTYGDAASLAARPYYINQKAYDQVANAAYLPTLPFNLPNAEGLSYLQQMGVEREELMRNLAPDSSAAQRGAAALIHLKLSEKEGELITTSRTDQDSFWNTGNTSDPVSVVKNVQAFLNTARISYEDLISLLSCTSWLNPPSPDGTMFIHHKTESCNLSEKEISGLDGPSLDRLHRFLRLSRALDDSQAWTYRNLDRAIWLPRIGSGTLNGDFLINVASIDLICMSLSTPGTQATVKNILNLFGPLADDLYRSVFVNTVKIGTIEIDFLPENVSANEARLPGAAKKLSVHVDYLARALGISIEHAKALVDAQGDPILSFNAIAIVHAWFMLSRFLKLSIPDLLLFRSLTPISITPNPDAMLRFIVSVGKILASQLSAMDVSYLLNHQADDLPTRDLSATVITTILQDIQKVYTASKASEIPEFDLNGDLDQNKSTVLGLIAKLEGVAPGDIVTLRGIMDGSIPTDGIDFVITKLKKVGSTSIASITASLISLKTDPSDPDLQRGFVNVLFRGVGSFLYATKRNTDLSVVIAKSFQIADDIARSILNNTHALQVLLFPDLAEGAISQANFPRQYLALQLLNMINFASQKFDLTSEHLGWLLKNSETLGWFPLDNLPLEPPPSPPGVDQLLQTLTFLDLLGAADFAPVKDPLNAGATLNIMGFFDQTLFSGPGSRPEAISHLAELTSWDKNTLEGLITHLGFDSAALRIPSNISRLRDAMVLIRRSNLPLDIAVKVATAVDMAVGTVAAIREALKQRYSDQDWLLALKNIQDRLRVRKRNALVALLLATNKSDAAIPGAPGLTSATDLTEHLLLDVEMGTETVTSRIIQAHASVQMFVQRLRMGLEQTPLVPSATEAVSWKQWDWMAQYRMWEANRKIFLYPENWIEPELRDDKSEIFQDLESALTQAELTDPNIEKATAAFMESLDGISNLEPMATFYQVELRTQHVFARTKGGDPVIYYYRKFIREQLWTPWEKVNGVDITGNHLIAFVRGNRLILAWPEFAFEHDQSQASKAPPIPDPDALKQNKGQESEPLRLRLAIRLVISERDPTTGKWSPRRISRDAVYWPDNKGTYHPAIEFPDTIPDDISLRYWDLGGSVGQMVSLVQYVRDREMGDREVSFGAFALAGCKGYPEPYRPDPNDKITGVAYRVSPSFQNMEFFTQRYRKARYRSTNSLSPLAIKTLLDGSTPRTILGKTYGRFAITYPSQIAMIDLSMILVQIYALVARKKGLGTSYAIPLQYMAANRSTVFTLPITIPLGTFMPFFYNDGATRSYTVIPGFYPKEGDARTASDIYPSAEKLLVLILRYLKMYTETRDMSIEKLRDLVNQDPDYLSLKKEWLDVYWGNSTNFRLSNFYHPLVCLLRKTLYSDGLDALFARKTQLATTPFKFSVSYAPTPLVKPAIPEENLEFNLIDSYASYNWEMFFHLPFEVACKLSADQQFESARRWFHYIFNPEGHDTPVGDGGPALPEAQQKYWQTKPFFQAKVADYTAELIDKILYQISEDPSGHSLKDWITLSLSLWRSNPYSPYAIARARPVAFQIAILIRYIKNIIDWGDSLFRQLTRETITQATQLYMLADKLLGPKPQVVPPALDIPIKSYNELEPDLDLFGNALVDLENLVPDVGSLPHHGAELPPDLNLLYFGIPQNDNMLQYWDLTLDRLSKIRHSLDIDGNPVSLALTAPPIDPGALVRAVAGGASIGSLAGEMAAPIPLYRFWYMTEKATELTTQLIALGQTLLSFLSRRDEEGLARLRAGLDVSILQSVRLLKEQAVQEADLMITSIGKSREVIVERQSYYQKKKLMNSWEKASVGLAISAGAVEIGVALGNVLAGGTKMIPNVTAGASGFGGSPQLTVTIGGGSIGSGLETMAEALAAGARILDKASAITAVQGGFQQRLEEWKFQGDLATKELAQVDAEAKVAAKRKDMATADLVAHGISTAAAKQIQNYMTAKYTNKELFDWCAGQISGAYFTAYKMAFSMARQAERCLEFELALNNFSAQPYIAPGYWNGLKSGLLAGEQLLTDIKRMETAYMAKNIREYELTKNISLEQIDPLALATLRAVGRCTFSIPEAVFDMDTPGHYLRRTRTVALSIPCVVGPLVSVSAKLTLVSHRYRFRSTLGTGLDKYAENPPGGDARFMYNAGARSHTIVTSTGVADSGVFALNGAAAGGAPGRDNSAERYLPFERTGAVGTYILELPTAVRLFDYNAISDVVLHIAYTAREGGSSLRSEVEKGLLERLNALQRDVVANGMYSVLSMRRNWSSQWWQLVEQRGDVALSVDVASLPYFATTAGVQATIAGLTLLARTKIGTNNLGRALVLNVSTVNEATANVTTVSVALHAVESLGGMFLGRPDPSVPTAGTVLGEEFRLGVSDSSDVRSSELVDILILVQYVLRKD